MKRLICMIVAFMLMLIFIRCATTTSEQRKETYDLKGSVGNQPFVGDTYNLSVRGQYKGVWW